MRKHAREKRVREENEGKRAYAFCDAKHQGFKGCALKHNFFPAAGWRPIFRTAQNDMFNKKEFFTLNARRLQKHQG